MDLGTVANLADLAARSLALALAGFAGVTFLTHWGVRTRRLPPMGSVSKTVRSLSDPFLRPIERTLVRRGGNPQDATLWFLGIAVVAGLLLIAVVGWVFGLIYAARALAGASPATWFELAFSWTVSLLIAAIFIRVFGAWFGMGRYHRWMRYVYRITDWLIEPIRRWLPPTGMLDLSPIVAWLVLVVLRSLVIGLLFR